MSIKIKVYNQSGEATKEIELNPDVFGVAANPALVHQAYVAQIANERQVLAHTKDRSEVRGGGRKPWRQKGTGRARAGSSRSPLWIGGGVTFGPTKDRNFKKNINRKMKQKALLMALSDRASQNNLFLIDKLEMAEYKTKVFNNLLMKLTVKTEEPDGQLKAGAGKEARKTKKAAENSEKGKSAVKKNKRSILIINDKSDKIVKYSARNLTGVKIISQDNINIVDLLAYQQLLLTEAAVKKLEERYAVKPKTALKSKI